MTQCIKQTANQAALKKVKAAARALYAISILCCFIGGIMFVARGQNAEVVVIAALLIIFGVLYGFLGRMVSRQSKMALIAATVLMGLNIASGIFSALQSGTPFALILPVAALTQLWPAFSALKELREGQDYYHSLRPGTRSATPLVA